jgi:hypothetical protein
MTETMLTCSTDRPWGLHAAVRSDQACPRCGWTAPGPLGDARDRAMPAGPAAGPLDGGAALRPQAA